MGFALLNPSYALPVVVQRDGRQHVDIVEADDETIRMHSERRGARVTEPRVARRPDENLTQSLGKAPRALMHIGAGNDRIGRYIGPMLAWHEASDLGTTASAAAISNCSSGAAGAVFNQTAAVTVAVQAEGVLRLRQVSEYGVGSMPCVLRGLASRGTSG
jgi:hypothetical protein